MDLSERLVRERRARLAAERLLEQKSRELFAANEKLAIHARTLSDQIVEQRQVVKSALSRAETLKDQNLRFVEDLDRAHTAAVIAERRLWDALETINDGFAVFDSAKRLVSANAAWIGPLEGKIVAPGCPYDEIIRHTAETIIDLGDETPDAFVARMLARIDGDPIDPVTLKLRDGSWIKVQERRARDGTLSASPSRSPNRCASGPPSTSCPMASCFLTGRNGFWPAISVTAKCSPTLPPSCSRASASRTSCATGRRTAMSPRLSGVRMTGSPTASPISAPPIPSPKTRSRAGG